MVAKDVDRPSGPSDYLLWLREHVGHELLLLPCVAALVRDDEGRLLLVRNVGNGRWGTVGGMVEPGESPGEAAVREVHEETGLTVELGDILGAVGGSDYIIQYPNGDVVAAITTVYDAAVVGGDLRPDGHEVDATRWTSEADLPTVDLNPFATAMLTELGIFDPADREPPRPQAGGSIRG